MSEPETTFAVVTCHSSTGMAGLAASIFVLGSLAGRLFSGKYLDLMGRRRLIPGGNTLFFLIGLTYFLPVPLAVFLVIRSAHGMMFGVVHTVPATVIVDFIPKERLGENIGVFSPNFVIATALGPFMGMTVARNFSYPAPFGVMTLSAIPPLLLAAAVFMAGLRQYPEHRTSHCRQGRSRAPPRPGHLDLLRVQRRGAGSGTAGDGHDCRTPGLFPHVFSGCRVRRRGPFLAAHGRRARQRAFPTRSSA